MAELPEAITIDAAAPTPRPIATAAPEPTPAAPNIPAPGPRTMILDGSAYPCIDEIPAGRVGDIISDQADLQAAADSDDPKRNALAVKMMLGLFDHFVEDDYLPALNEALRRKTNPISLETAISAANKMLETYFRGEPTPK